MTRYLFWGSNKLEVNQKYSVNCLNIKERTYIPQFSMGILLYLMAEFFFINSAI